MSNPPRLGGDLIVRKGEAAPAVANRERVSDAHKDR